MREAQGKYDHSNLPQGNVKNNLKVKIRLIVDNSGLMTSVSGPYFLMKLGPKFRNRSPTPIGP
jgi:hypothetical protein